MWTLLIVVLTNGFISQSASFYSIPMMNKDACTTAAKSVSDSSSRTIGYICISSETGEIVKFIKEQ